ncbi:MAG TPA: M56 family metallopeptidase [Longimicrobium sp.]|jgi:beta-lactamase regulating signal transducer with metallopeptidase domain
MNGALDLASNTDWLVLLAQLAAKATLVLLLTAAAAALLWRSSAAVRHLVWCVGVACVVCLPLLAVVLPAWELPLLPARTVTAPAVAAPITEAPVTAPASAALPVSPTRAPDPSPESGSWLPLALAGVAGAGILVGMLWIALGFWGVSRIGRRAERVRDPEWLRTIHDAAEGLGLRRPVLLLRSRGAVMPATWGLLWPSVVVPSAADGWSRERRHAVLAHELAHVKRFDCLTQTLAQVACALFWWHPAVWYAARRLRVERERACDDLVLRSGTRPSDYASHLLDIARSYRGGMRMAAPAMVSMARPSHLESRLLWVLDAARARNVPSKAATLLVAFAGLLIVTPLAAMRPGERAAGDPSAQVTQAPPAGAAIRPTGAAVKGKGVEEKEVDGSPKRAPAVPVAAEAPAAAAETAVAAAEARAEAGPSAPRDTLPREVSAEDLISMRAVGVDARYIDDLRAAGYGGLGPQQLISMRAVGVSARYPSEMNAAGLGRLTPDQLVSLRSLGVTAGYLAELRSEGVTPRSVNEASALAANRVTGAYAAGWRAAGYPGLSANQLVSLRALGATPAWVRELADQGLTGLSVEALKGLRALGVTAEYVRGLKAAGMNGLDAGTVSGLRAVGVTGAYARELAELGLTGLSTRDLASLKANGVTPAWIRQMRAAGFAARTADQLIRLRVSGLSDELLRSRGL